MSSTANQENTECSFKSQCNTLEAALINALGNANTTLCPLNVTRIIYVLGDGGAYKGSGNSRLIVSLDNMGDEYEQSEILIQSADKPVDPNPKHPLPLAASNSIFDGEYANFLFNFNNVPPRVTIRGITFQNGRYRKDEGQQGAPIYVSPKSTSINFDSCLFQNNYGSIGGSLLWNPAGESYINNCQFLNNSANPHTGQGGAISFIQGQLTTVTNCVFSRNTAAHGGAIYVKKSSVLVQNCQVSFNNASQGGGIYAQGITSLAAQWVNISITDNTADYGAGLLDMSSLVTYHNISIMRNVAMYKGGGAFFEDSVSSMANSQFIGNVANDGGGIWVFDDVPQDKQLLIKTTEFRDNIAHNYGGALYCNSSTARLNSANTFENNEANDHAYNTDFCTPSCLTAANDCGCVSGCGLPAPPASKNETRIAIAIFLPVTALLLGIIAFLLWKTNKKNRAIQHRNYDEIHLTPTSPDSNEQL
eukprot:gene393-462_t